MTITSRVILIVSIILLALGIYSTRAQADCYRPSPLTKMFGVAPAFATPIHRMPCMPGEGPRTPSDPSPPPPLTWALTTHWGITGEENNYFAYTRSFTGPLFEQDWDWDNDGFFEWGQYHPGSFDLWDMYLLTEHEYSSPGEKIAKFKSTDSNSDTSSDTARTVVYASCAFGMGSNCTNTIWDGFKWLHPIASNGILYTIDVGSYPASSPIPLADAVTAIENALSRWDAASGGVRFIPNPFFTVGGVPGRCEMCGGRAPRTVQINNSIYWATDPDEFHPAWTLNIGNGYRTFPQLVDALGGTVAATTCSYNSTREEFNDSPQFDAGHPTNPYLGITDCDTALNPNVSWSVSNTPVSGTWDIESFIMHQLGNWLGLGDLRDPASLGLIMHTTTGASEVKRNLGVGDLNGIHYLYGL